MLNSINKFIYKNIIFFAILILGISLRILWIINVPTIPVSDFNLFYKAAQSIASGNGFRVSGYLTAYEPIGYPAFLALIFKFWGSNILIAKIANVFLAIISLSFTYLITKISLGKKSLALLAMFLLSVLPLHIIYTSVLGTEIIFTTIFLIATFLITLQNKNRLIYILLGILLGILSLIKPYMMVYQFAFFTLELIEIKSFKKCIVNLFIVSICMLITICPWTIRNYTVFHKIIPISTNGGYNLYVNNNPEATGSWQNPFEIPNSPVLIYKHSQDNFWDEVMVDEVGKKSAYNWIIHNPYSFCKIGLQKLTNVFIKYDDGYWAASKLKNNMRFKYEALLGNINKNIHYTTLFVLGIFFLILLFDIIKRKSVEHLPLIVVMNISFYILITFVFEGQPRYLFPLWPLFIIAFCYLLNRLVVFSKYNLKILHKD